MWQKCSPDAGDHRVACLIDLLDPLHFSIEHFMKPFGGEAEDARRGREMLEHIIGSGGGSGINIVSRHFDAHPAGPPGARAGRAVGQTGVFAIFGLQAMNQIDRPGQNVIFVIKSAVEIEQHGGVGGEIIGHRGV